MRMGDALRGAKLAKKQGIPIADFCRLIGSVPPEWPKFSLDRQYTDCSCGRRASGHEAVITKFAPVTFSAQPVRAPKMPLISDGQFGDDTLPDRNVRATFKAARVSVDVGCFHPIELSNTYEGHQHGWGTFAIDAKPNWRAALAEVHVPGIIS